MSREIVKKLKSLRHAEVNPRSAWVKSNREILLSQIKNTGTSHAAKPFTERFWQGMSVFIPQKVVLNVVRPLAILMVVAIVGTSGWITAVDASYEALPGDWLYPAKRAVEKTQIATASLLRNDTSRTQLHAEFAKRRASEIKKVVKSDLPDKGDKVIKTLSDLKKEIDSVSSSLEDVKVEKQKDDQVTVEMIKEVQKNTVKIQEDLKEVKDDLSTEESEENQGLAKEINEVNKLNKEIDFKVVEVVVTKHLEDDSKVTKEDVENVIATALKKTQDDVKKAKDEVQVMSGIIEGVKSSATGTLAMAAATTTPESAGITTKLDTLSNQAKQAVEKTNTASVEVDKKVIEVKEILQTGSLDQVVDKVKEVVEISKETDVTTEETIIAVKEAVPLKVVEVEKTEVDAVMPNGTGATSTATSSAS